MAVSVFKRIAKFLHRNLTIKGAGGQVTVVTNQSIPNDSNFRASTKDTLGTGTEVVITSRAGTGVLPILEIALDNVDKMRLDERGILNVSDSGGSPATNPRSEWGDTYSGFSINDDLTNWVDDRTNTYITRNAYYNGSTWFRTTNGVAYQIDLGTNHYTLRAAVTGSAGTGIGTWVDIYKVSASEFTLAEDLFSANFFGRHDQGLSPSVGANTRHIFPYERGAIWAGASTGAFNLSYNTYTSASGVNRAIVTDSATTISIRPEGQFVYTAPSASASSVQTFTSRTGTPTAGRQWTDVIGSRAMGTIYQNTTGYEIHVAVSFLFGAGHTVALDVDTVTPPVLEIGRTSGDTINQQLYACIPNNAYYRVREIVAGATNTLWKEMR